MIKGEYDPKEHAKILYNMELHETIKCSEELYITRVPGGWLYDRCMRENDNRELIGFVNTVFVPYNNEFEITGKSIPGSF